MSEAICVFDTFGLHFCGVGRFYASGGKTRFWLPYRSLGILEMARENAAHVLVPMLTRLGYDERNIVISFRKDFTTADMLLLLEREGRTEKLK